MLSETIFTFYKLSSITQENSKQGWFKLCQSWAESEITDSESAPQTKTLNPNPVCNQISESKSDPDKILLLLMELMLNTGAKCLGVAFILKVMVKLLGVLFQELRVEGSRCFDVVSQLLLITQHSHIGMTFAHCRAKILIPFLSPVRLTQAGPE